MSVQLDVNPLRQGLPRERAVDPCVVVIFGATGDLARRKLLPALYHLYLGGLLPRGFAIVAYASPDWTIERYREWAREAIAASAKHLPTEGKTWDGFSELLHYTRRTDDPADLATSVDSINTSLGAGGNYLFYLAVPPQVFGESAVRLGKVGLARDETGRGWRRIVVEKPFGTDLESARELTRTLQSVFPEEQIYRIDHYLGKETVQNILVFRFDNRFVEPLLCADHVDHIQITVAETLGVEGRGGYYDASGALRDIVQNHVLQVMSLICMEPPSSFDPECIRDEKLKVFRSVRRVDPLNVSEVALRGQYSAGTLVGEDVAGYLHEDKVDPHSTTETFAALKLYVDNDRWRNVPIYIRTGKRLAKRVTEVGIQLKHPSRMLVAEGGAGDVDPNLIAFNIQPDEGISVRFEAKVPGLVVRTRPVRMEFKYGAAFEASVPDAYERLLLDALLGDPSLYPRADGVEAAWQIIDPILEGWKLTDSPVYSYAPGGWGPRESTEFIERDGRSWRIL